VHTPLVFLGAFFAHRRPVGENPVGTNTIPRMIPPAPWYSHTYLLTPLLAILPFGVSFNELYDLMEAMWSHHVYYFFNYVLVIFVLLTIIIAEVSVILCYFQLANENYHWWWRAFYIPAAVVVCILPSSLRLLAPLHSLSFPY
jgi:transmembrane 9 superfamily protein 2/4